MRGKLGSEFSLTPEPLLPHPLDCSAYDIPFLSQAWRTTACGGNLWREPRVLSEGWEGGMLGPALAPQAEALLLGPVRV